MVCRQLGFSGATRARCFAAYGRGLVQSGWIKSTAKEERQLYLIAEVMIGESKTVITKRMLEWCVTSGWAVQTVLLD